MAGKIRHKEAKSEQAQREGITVGIDPSLVGLLSDADKADLHNEICKHQIAGFN